MKKLVIIFLTFLATIFSVKTILAQSTSPTPSTNDYAIAYQTYINKTGTYQIAHNNYLTARANYLASQSIDSQDKAMAAGVAMLQARDDVVTSYLTVIKNKILITQGISSGDQSSYATRFDTEVSWYASHSTRLTSAGSLGDLVKDSNEASSQFTSSTSLLIYPSIVALGLGNNAYIREELKNKVATLQAKIDEIKANQDKDVSSIQRSMIDVKNKLDRSQGKDDDAQNLMNAVTNGQRIPNSFQTAEGDLADGNAYLKEANQSLLQIITQIKSAN